MGILKIVADYILPPPDPRDVYCQNCGDEVNDNKIDESVGRINFLVLMYKGVDMDAVLDDLKEAVDDDLQIKYKLNRTPIAYVETSLDNFEAAFGTRPPYTQAKGWQYENDEAIKVPASLDQKIRAIELSLRLEYA